MSLRRILSRQQQSYFGLLCRSSQDLILDDLGTSSHDYWPFKRLTGRHDVHNRLGARRSCETVVADTVIPLRRREQGTVVATSSLSKISHRSLVYLFSRLSFIPLLETAVTALGLLAQSAPDAHQLL